VTEQTDQRGYGRSSNPGEGRSGPEGAAPAAAKNVHLAADVELAGLAYAIAHPATVQTLILRGVFLCPDGAAILTIEWIDRDQHHARTLYRNPTHRE